MTIPKGFKIDDNWEPPIKIWYDSPPICEIFVLPKDSLLKGWASYLDGLSKLPKDKQLFLISKAIGKSVVIKQVEKNFFEDELAQLIKFDKKMDIFKTKLGEHL